MSEDLNIPAFMARAPSEHDVTIEKIRQIKEKTMGKKKQDSNDPGIGHNSGADPEEAKAELAADEEAKANTKADKAVAGSVGGIAPEILRAYVERIERLEEEKKNLAGDIREVYSEAKGNGFEPKIIRKLVSLRKQDKADRQEEAELMRLYMRAMGMDPELADLY